MHLICQKNVEGFLKMVIFLAQGHISHKRLKPSKLSGFKYSCPDEYYNTHGPGDRVNPEWTKNVQSWQDCSALCLKRRDCNYWTWHHGDSGEWAHKCVTMTDAAGKGYEPNVVSGERSCFGMKPIRHSNSEVSN